MIPESRDLFAGLFGIEQIQVPQLVETPSDSPPAEVRTPEEVQAVDAVFATGPTEESELVQGLLGMWAGTLLLHDVVKDTLTTEDEDEEEDAFGQKGKKNRPCC